MEPNDKSRWRKWERLFPRDSRVGHKTDRRSHGCSLSQTSQRFFGDTRPAVSGAEYLSVMPRLSWKQEPPCFGGAPSLTDKPGNSGTSARPVSGRAHKLRPVARSASRQGIKNSRCKRRPRYRGRHHRSRTLTSPLSGNRPPTCCRGCTSFRWRWWAAAACSPGGCPDGHGFAL